MKLTTKAHEWLADNIKGVQYPNVRKMNQEEPKRFFKHQMHWSVRIFVTSLMLIVIPFLLVVLYVIATFAWALITT